MIKKSEPFCDKDCFNCPFKDCILDDLDAEDYRQLEAINRIIFQSPDKDKLAAYQRAYYQANKDKLAAQR